MTAPTSALVLGATGFTGREVVRLAIASGLTTTAHVRPDSSQRKHWQTHFESQGAQVAFTPWTGEGMRALMEGTAPDLVFALLGTTRKRGKSSGDTYESVDYGLTKLALDATLATAPHARFVYLSSLGVRPETRNPYLRVRARLEKELTDSGLACTIARPSFITGERDEERLGEHVGAAIADGTLAVLGFLGAKGWRARYRSTSNTILAEALVQRAMQPRSHVDIVPSEELRS